MKILRKLRASHFFVTIVIMLLSNFSYANQWQDIEKKAKGQKVYFHAWGGSQEINKYLNWVSKELKKHHGIEFHHVKVTDIAESTTRLLAEKIAGRSENGSVDLLWINGENFKSLKDNQMLYGPFVETLPNWKKVDQSLPVTVDFSEKTEGLEAPWGIGQLVFIHDDENLKHPPKSFSELKIYAQKNPFRLTYPRPPEFHGVSFLKALLIELTNNDSRLQQPVDEKTYQMLTKSFWQYLDEFHQVAWRKGEQFPQGLSQHLQLLDDNQVDLAMSFNPNSVYSAQSSGQLAESTKVYAFSNGALTNVHYLAIPWNSVSKEASMVAINFLLSPEAQSRKGDIKIWGDPSVLQKRFLKGSSKKFSKFESIAEPHPSWQLAIEKEWLQRYGS